MNLLDALRTGKPFRRSTWNCEFMEPESEGHGYRCFQFTIGDMLADDWIIKQEPLTKQEFWQIYRDWMIEMETKRSGWAMSRDSELSKLIGKLADRLGFR